MKSIDDKETITNYHQINTLFAVSKDEWHTKEDSGKCIVYTVVCRKAKATSKSEKIKPVALAQLPSVTRVLRH